MGDKATEEEAKAEAEKYRLLHFAAHAVLDDRNPMYSRIMLSRDAKREDGMLEAWELMKLDLTAEMVVLSACQTARGRVRAGEGMIGMSWALFVAGSPSVGCKPVESRLRSDVGVDDRVPSESFASQRSQSHSDDQSRSSSPRRAQVATRQIQPSCLLGGVCLNR